MAQAVAYEVRQSHVLADKLEASLPCCTRGPIGLVGQRQAVVALLVVQLAIAVVASGGSLLVDHVNAADCWNYQEVFAALDYGEVLAEAACWNYQELFVVLDYGEVLAEAACQNYGL